MDFTAEKKESESKTENAHPTTLDSSSQLASTLDSNNKEIEERQARELKAGLHPLNPSCCAPDTLGITLKAPPNEYRVITECNTSFFTPVSCSCSSTYPPLLSPNIQFNCRLYRLVTLWGTDRIGRPFRRPATSHNISQEIPRQLASFANSCV